MSDQHPSPDYRAVFDALPLPATLIDRNGTIADLNEASVVLAHRVGRPITKQDRIGHPFASFAVAEEHRPRLAALVEKALAEGQAEDPRWEFVAAGGERFWTAFHAAAVRDAAGRPTGVVVLRPDITERVRQERLRDSQERLRDALWRMSDPEELAGLLQVLHRELVALLPLTAACSVQLRDPDSQQWISYHLDWSGAQVMKVHPSPHGAVMTCWQSQRPVYRPDLSVKDPFSEARALWSSDYGYSPKVRAVLDVPFTQGTLAVNSHQADAYAEGDVRLLQDMAQILSVGFSRMADMQRLALRTRELEQEVAQRQQVEAVLRRNEAQMRSLLQAVSVGIARLVDRVMVEVSDRFCAMSGYTRDELIGHSTRMLYLGDEDFEAVGQQIYPGLAATGIALAEARVCRKDGTVLEALLSCAAADAGDPGRGTIVTVVDVTQRHRAEEALRQSEQRYRRLLETPRNLLVFHLDLDGHYLYVGPQIEQWTGVLPSEIQANRGSGVKLTHPEDVGATVAAFHAAARTGTVQEVEFRYRHADGSWHWAHETLTPIPGSTGAPEAVQAVLQDTTARRQVEERLQLDLSLQRLRLQTMEMRDEAGWSTVVACFQEEVARWMPANASCINVLHLDRQCFTSHGMAPATRPDGTEEMVTEPEVWEALVRTMQGGPPLCRRSRRDPLFSRRLPAEVNSIVDVGYLGGTVGVNSTREDAFSPQHVQILERFAEVISQGYRRLEDLRALREAEERFRQAQKMEAIGQLAGGVAHNFNNLLTVVLGQAQLALRQTGRYPELREALEDIQKAGSRGVHLAKSLLTFSRRQALQPERLDLNAAVADSAKMLQQLLGDEIELVTVLGQEPIGVETDRGQLTQLILNLVVNARDAMPGGGRIAISTGTRVVTAGEQDADLPEVPGRYAVLQVEDTGTGMPPEIMEHIFEPFFTTKEVGRGTGLGLAMVYGAVRQSHGHVTVSSSLEQGSTFTIYLPATEFDRPDRSQPSSGGALATESRTILVVDDDDAVRQVVCRMLSAHGYMALPAASGVEALEMVHARGASIDLLLTDVSMPTMDGWQLAATMRATIPELPVLFMSGYPEVDDATDLPLGRTAFLAKPIMLRDLLREIQALLRRDTH